jgi:hypothetical protein
MSLSKSHFSMPCRALLKKDASKNLSWLSSNHRKYGVSNLLCRPVYLKTKKWTIFFCAHIPCFFNKYVLRLIFVTNPTHFPKLFQIIFYSIQVIDQVLQKIYLSFKITSIFLRNLFRHIESKALRIITY